MRQSARSHSDRRTMAILIAAALAVVWAVYLIRWDRTNNLYGILMVILVPVTLVLLTIAGILLAAAR